MSKRAVPPHILTGSGAISSRAEVLAAFHVSRETSERLDRFVTLLSQWQRRINLVSSSSLAKVWTRHVADSLQLLDLGPDARIWVDLGSGAGLPGMVIACALAGTPGAVVHLVESNLKKAAFLREAARVTGAPAIIHAERIETFVQRFAGPADVVTARALAPLNTLIGYAAPLLKSGAKGLFPKGQDVAAELTEASIYWNIEAMLVPSKTDPRGNIVVIKHAQSHAVDE
jgi:16S rRNA (guanine527-N7)-methyltransferase